MCVMKKFLLFSIVVAGLAILPSTGSAKLLLDIPPILAGRSQETCDVNTPCSAGSCCNGRCYSSGVCCNNSHYPSGECCNNSICYTSCLNNVCEAAGGLNDTGITWGAEYPSGNNSTCTSMTTAIAAQDCSSNSAFSFAAVAGGCVKDNVTGLTWSPDQGTASSSGVQAKIDNANNLNSGAGLCGVKTWHIPSVKELLSIVSYYKTNPAVDAVSFPDTISTVYWSSNTWSVSFALGSASKGVSSANVRLVSGTMPPANLDDTKITGTVIDKSTKLMWKKCLEGYTLSGATCVDGGSTKIFTWQAALQQPALVGNFAGKTGWRLPNVKELQSIVDESKSSPALDSAKFPNVPAASEVWSSSPYAGGMIAGDNSKSWSVKFDVGTVTTPFARSTNTLNVRLVRDCIGTECD